MNEELDEEYIKIKYDIPLAEIITDFFDKLKSLSQGYASMDYFITGFKQSKIEKVDLPHLMKLFRLHFC